MKAVPVDAGQFYPRATVLGGKTNAKKILQIHFVEDNELPTSAKRNTTCFPMTW